nr:hypothetical protein [uncultured bacterium]
MAPLTAERNTPRRTGDLFSLPAAAAKKFFAGAIVARDAAGRATPGATAADILGVGRCAETVDNSAGAADAVTVQIEKGIFLYANSATDPVVAADVGGNCYIVDDQTVSHTDTNQSVAGVVFAVEAVGVWVKFE